MFALPVPLLVPQSGAVTSHAFGSGVGGLGGFGSWDGALGLAMRVRGGESGTAAKGVAAVGMGG